MSDREYNISKVARHHSSCRANKYIQCCPVVQDQRPNVEPGGTPKAF